MKGLILGIAVLVADFFQMMNCIFFHKRWHVVAEYPVPREAAFGGTAYLITWYTKCQGPAPEKVGSTGDAHGEGAEMMDYKQIMEMPTSLGRSDVSANPNSSGWHESCLRAYHILAKVK